MLSPSDASRQARHWTDPGHHEPTLRVKIRETREKADQFVLIVPRLLLQNGALYPAMTWIERGLEGDEIVALTRYVDEMDLGVSSNAKKIKSRDTFPFQEPADDTRWQAWNRLLKQPFFARSWAVGAESSPHS